MARTTTPFDDLLADLSAQGEAKGRAEGRAEGKAEGKAEAVLRVLRRRCGTPSADLTAQVLAERDVDVLGRWLDLAISSTSLEDFARAIKPPH